MLIYEVAKIADIRLTTADEEAIDQLYTKFRKQLWSDGGISTPKRTINKPSDEEELIQRMREKRSCLVDEVEDNREEQLHKYELAMNNQIPISSRVAL